MGGSSRVHWMGSQRMQPEGLKQHICVLAPHPWGWSGAALIQKQASLKQMNPEQPFWMTARSRSAPLLSDVEQRWRCRCWRVGPGISGPQAGNGS